MGAALSSARPPRSVPRPPSRWSRSRRASSKCRACPGDRRARVPSTSARGLAVRVAVDIGGTFTDVVAIDDAGQRYATKALTTPENHVLGIRDGLDKLALDLAGVDLF